MTMNLQPHTTPPRPVKLYCELPRSADEPVSVFEHVVDRARVGRALPGSMLSVALVRRPHPHPYPKNPHTVNCNTLLTNVLKC